MAVGFSNTNKPLNPRGNDASPKGYNRAALYSGKALDFDGVNDSVDIGQNLGFLNTGDFTLLANAKFDVLSGDEPIMGQGSASSGAAILALINAVGKLRFAFYGDDLDWDEDIQTGKWYSLAFTFNRTTKARAIYVNGQLAVSDVTTLTPSATSNNFVIGKVPYSATYADAQITGVKAFSTALTAAQVADLYNNPEKVVPTGVDNTALKLWLPMQEGAGTTAYDGSGNGNHGTISGATYVNGVGAPVSQTAVISWNKGTNLAQYSEELDNGYYSKSGVTITANDATAPNGLDGADKVLETTANTYRDVVSKTFAVTATNSYTLSAFVKNGLGRDGVYLYTNDGSGNGRCAKFNLSTGAYIGNAGAGGWTAFDSYGIETAPNGWYRIHATLNSSNGGNYTFNVGLSDNTNDALGPYVGDVTKGLYIWGYQFQNDASVGPYIPTLSTAQTSPVLLPQGLTSGRDITGVNLFENVRKQGALNLDGNSWAEVHDNASLDVTSGVTAEAWVYWVSPSASKGILSKWGAVDFSWLFQARDNSSIRLYIRDSANYLVESSTLTEGWRHLCATYDGVTLRMYVDGQADTTTAHTGSIDIIEEPVKIGAYGAITSTTYEHDIAQPRIYNRALTAVEVLQNYNSGKNTYK